MGRAVRSPPGAACDDRASSRGESRYKVVVGKRLIGQITLIKGNNASRFHGRITMQVSQVYLNISLMPGPVATGRRGGHARAFSYASLPVGPFRSSSVIRKGRSSELFRNAQSVFRERRQACRRIKFVLPS